MGIGDWGLGIGDWGLGQSPIPNPQSPIPNPQSPLIYFFTNNESIINKNKRFNLYKYTKSKKCHINHYLK